MEVIKHTELDENILVKIPGERGANYYFLLVGNMYMSPESKSTVKYTRYKEEVQINYSTCTEA